MALAESMAVKYIFTFIKYIFILNVHFIVYMYIFAAKTS